MHSVSTPTGLLNLAEKETRGSLGRHCGMYSVELATSRPELDTNTSLSEVVLVTDTSTANGTAYSDHVPQVEGSSQAGVL